jgi:hypothetical protein
MHKLIQSYFLEKIRQSKTLKFKNFFLCDSEHLPLICFATLLDDPTAAFQSLPMNIHLSLEKFNSNCGSFRTGNLPFSPQTKKN